MAERKNEMALRWDWKQKIGELTVLEKFGGSEEEITINLYQGNAFLIMTHEYKSEGKEMYELYGFFLDKDHMRRCFGLDRKPEDTHGPIFEDWKKIRINKAKYRYTKDLLTALSEAFDNISIEIYTDEETK